MTEHQLENEIMRVLATQVMYLTGESSASSIDSGILTVKVSKQYRDLMHDWFTIDDAYVFKRPASFFETESGLEWLARKVNSVLKALRKAE